MKKPLIVAHSVRQHSLASALEAALSPLCQYEETDIDISVRHKASVRTIQVDHAGDAPKRPSYRIRRCEGNRDAWLIAALREDGSEIDSYGGWTTSYSIDSLLKHAGHLTPKPGEIVEFVP